MWQTTKELNTKSITRLRLKQVMFFFLFPKIPKRKKQWLQSISKFWQRGEKDKFSVNNTLISEFHFESGVINVSMGQIKETLKLNVVSTFEETKNLFLEKNRILPVARKSLSKLKNLRRKPKNNKTEEVIETFCNNCHNYKEEIDNLFKQKTYHHISLNKRKEATYKIQTKIRKLQGNIIKLKTDTETKKSEVFSCEYIS